MRSLRFMLRFIGVVQLFFGVLFTVAPAAAATVFHLHPSAPSWVNWLFIMMGARFLGYGVGMFVAARDPIANVAWINTMIVIQIADWLSTIGYLLAHAMPFSSVAPAAVLPVVFVGGLLRWHPRRLAPLDRTVVAAAAA
jgi:hypothetical protein